MVRSTRPPMRKNSIRAVESKDSGAEGLGAALVAGALEIGTVLYTSGLFSLSWLEMIGLTTGDTDTGASATLPSGVWTGDEKGVVLGEDGGIGFGLGVGVGVGLGFLVV